jgi:hypothetical protein
MSLRGYDGMSQFICPLCGKFVSVRFYDPSGFEDDILLVQVRGLGRGKGVEIVETYSLLEGGYLHTYKGNSVQIGLVVCK